MRPLTEDELKTFFTKLAKYVGKNIKLMLDAGAFRLHRERVYYLDANLLRHAAALPHDKVLAVGTPVGKFTKTKKFKLHITCLDLLAEHAAYKVWLKPSAEQSFLYGNHVLKAGLGRISEDTPQYQGVVVLSMSDVPLGFGVAAKSTAETRKLEPQAIVAIHQADVGEYLRDEESLC